MRVLHCRSSGRKMESISCSPTMIMYIPVLPPTFSIRLPIYATLPIRWKIIICEPLLGPIDLRKYLAIREKGGIPMVRELVCGGESGSAARICNYNWILSLREQCMEYGVPFCFQQTDANFQKDGRVYRIPRKLQQIQAQKARLIHIDILLIFL